MNNYFNYTCNAHHYHNSLFSLSFGEISEIEQKRLVLVKVTLREPADHICYFASWHGHNNNYENMNGEPITMDDDRRKDEARILIEEIRKITKGHPFIIGGDFNLKASEFPVIDNNIVVKRDKGDSIDYFVYGDFKNAEGFPNGERLEYLVPLDHKPIKTTVTLSNNAGRGQDGIDEITTGVEELAN